MALIQRLSTNDHEILLIRFLEVVIILSASLFRIDEEWYSFSDYDTSDSENERDEDDDGAELGEKNSPFV